MDKGLSVLAHTDPVLWEAIEAEFRRQEDHIELIASENYVSRAVLEAQGSVLTNKYAEGYPGKRYYGGCQYVDIAEELAIERAKKLFDCKFANVQPNSGSQMNQAVFLALLKPGETFMGLDLNSGGHLTHGSPVNMSGKWFNVVPYGLDPETELIDYEAFCGTISDEAAEAARDSTISVGQLKEMLDAREAGETDFVLIDPPRAGAEDHTIELIAKMAPKQISYVSCEPSILARDLRILLDRGYQIDAMTAIDLFPQTHHVETVVRLRGSSK